MSSFGGLSSNTFNIVSTKTILTSAYGGWIPQNYVLMMMKIMMSTHSMESEVFPTLEGDVDSKDTRLSFYITSKAF